MPRLIQLELSLLANKYNTISIVRKKQNTQFCGDQSKEEQNHEDYHTTSISNVAHRGLHG